METETGLSVRKVADEWIEIDAKSGMDGEYPTDPVKLRPGTLDGTVKITDVAGLGSEIKITDLREGLELVELEQRP